MEEAYYFNSLYQSNRKTTVDRLNNMNTQIDSLIKEIKSKELSPMEEIMCVYDYVKQFEFVRNDSSVDTRRVDGVLAEKKAVCAGFSDTFNEILSRMGYHTAILESYIGEVSHMHSIVEVKDPKYEINGIYNFDATFDSDNKDSYAYFGRSMEEISKLYDRRKARGCSIALMEGNTDIPAIENEIPLRTMNIINGFFPSQEHYEYLNQIMEEGKDKNNWKKLNEPLLFQLYNLGFKFRRAENIPLDTIEEVIRNVKKSNGLSDEEIEEDINAIKEVTNTKFKKDYSDPRLVFKTISKDHIEETNYSEYLEQIQKYITTKSNNEEIVLTFKFSNGQENKVNHSVIKINGDNHEVIFKGEFTDNYDFGRNFLVPEVNTLVEESMLPNGTIDKPKYFNTKIRDYMMNSDNGYTLVIEDGNLDLIQSIDIKAKKQSMEQAMNQNLAHQDERIKGYTNILMLTVIVGFILGLLAFIFNFVL